MDSLKIPDGKIKKRLEMFLLVDIFKHEHVDTSVSLHHPSKRPDKGPFRPSYIPICFQPFVFGSFVIFTAGTYEHALQKTSPLSNQTRICFCGLAWKKYYLHPHRFCNISRSLQGRFVVLEPCQAIPVCWSFYSPQSIKPLSSACA